MTNTATFRRAAAAAGLVSTAVIMAVATVLSPEFPSGFADRLAAIEAGGTGALVSGYAFTLAQLPFLAGVLGIGHLLRNRSPRLSNLGTSLAVVGIFGHAVHGGVTAMQVEMAADTANRDAHAAILEGLESGPAVMFMAMGLLGTVLGILLLSIGLFRAHVGPRWIGPALWAFLVVEFAGSAVSDWSLHLAGLLFTVSLAALGVVVWRTPESAWALPAAPSAEASRVPTVPSDA